MLVGPLYISSRAEKMSLQGHLAGLHNPTDVGWTVFYRLLSRERLYKVAFLGCTPEKNRSWLDHFVPTPEQRMPL